MIKLKIFVPLFLFTLITACGGAANGDKNDTNNITNNTSLSFSGVVNYESQNLQGKKVTLYKYQNLALEEKGQASIDSTNHFKIENILNDEQYFQPLYLAKIDIAPNLSLYSVANQDNSFKFDLIEHLKAAYAMRQNDSNSTFILNALNLNQPQTNLDALTPAITNVIKALAVERGVGFETLLEAIFKHIQQQGTLDFQSVVVNLKPQAQAEYLALIAAKNRNDLNGGFYKTKNFKILVNRYTEPRSNIVRDYQNYSNQTYQWQLTNSFFQYDVALKGLELNPSNGAIRDYFLSLYKLNKAPISIKNVMMLDKPAFNKAAKFSFKNDNYTPYSRVKAYLHEVDGNNQAECGVGKLVYDALITGDDGFEDEHAIDKKHFNQQNSKVKLSFKVSDVFGSTDCFLHDTAYTIKNDNYQIIESYPSKNGAFTDDRNPYIVFKTNRAFKQEYNTKYLIDDITCNRYDINLTNTAQNDGSYLVKAVFQKIPETYPNCRKNWNDNLADGHHTLYYTIDEFNGSLPFVLDRKAPVLTITSSQDANRLCTTTWKTGTKQGECRNYPVGHTHHLIRNHLVKIKAGKNPDDTWRRDTFPLRVKVTESRLKSWRLTIPAQYLKNNTEYEKVFDSSVNDTNDFNFDTKILKNGHHIPFNFEAVDMENRKTIKTVRFNVDNDSHNLNMYFKVTQRLIKDTYDLKPYGYTYRDNVLPASYGVKESDITERSVIKGSYRLLLCTSGSVLSSYDLTLEDRRYTETNVWSTGAYTSSHGWFKHSENCPDVKFPYNCSDNDFTGVVPNEVCRPIWFSASNFAKNTPIQLRIRVSNFYGDKREKQSTHVTDRDEP